MERPALVLGPAARRRPPPPLDPFPERADPAPHWLDPVETALLAAPRALVARWEDRRARRAVRAVGRQGLRLAAMAPSALDAEAMRLRLALRREGIAGAAMVQTLALIREVSHRTLGLRHHDVQVLGALTMLSGRVAEMDTGEGKTITAGLAAAAAAMAGLPVHVVTVNDYLAERDADGLRPMFDVLGLSVGLVSHGVAPADRRAAYRADIVYASNKEIAFDYLRDRLLLGDRAGPATLKARGMIAPPGQRLPVMRGLHFAIVDEADSVMIDEARTPLILSQESNLESERRWVAEAHALAGRLVRDADWRLLPGEQRIEILPRGRERLAELTRGAEPQWRGKIRREDAVHKALTARHVYRSGEHYLVREGRVEIVDEYTGRIMADRSWSDGLHQLVEEKEGCEITPRKLTLARITYQRFFRRYRHLAGMTGTARETQAEFWSVYRLRVARIPPDTPSRMNRAGTTICADRAAKQALVAARAASLSAAGRAVLIGARSVSAAQGLSAALTAAGVPHAVLSAELDREEAAIIAAAGEAGRVTVATNMAGRGVDIAVAPEVLAGGGLHVILTERHDAGRIDRQLEGRTARRGQPGSVEAILSLGDALLDGVPHHPLRLLAGTRTPLSRRAAARLIRAAQRRAERLNHRARSDLLRQDTKLAEILAFSGRGE
jgi:preprotein translocase subunit SecA